MSSSFAFEKFTNALSAIGRGALNTLYPNDIENFLIIFELVDSKNEVEDLFVFPINPQAIKEDYQTTTTIKRTYNTVIAIDNKSFNPVRISLSGNFGKSFKVLVGRELVSGLGFVLKRGKGEREFFSNVKTGYGCVKILQSFVERAQKPDVYGFPRVLNFYNLFSGNNYIVKPVTFSLNQDLGSNMIWNYNLTLEALGRVEDYSFKEPNSVIGEMNVDGVIQENINSAVTKISLL